MMAASTRRRALETGPPAIVAAVSLSPPESGMAVMNRMATGTYTGAVPLCVVDISMCRTMSEMRHLSVRKLVRLFAAPFRILWVGIQSRSRMLYFVPSSPSIGGLVKDAWILALCRLWFRQRVYHCHSGGAGVFLQSLTGPTGWLLRRVVGAPLAVIRVSESSPADHHGFGATAGFVLPNCVAEERELLAIPRSIPSSGPGPEATALLFVGLHAESKGLFVLLQALQKAIASGLRCTLRTVGSFNDSIFEQRCRAFVREHSLTERVIFLGPLFGRGKVEEFAAADVLVFPTHFECETFGLVVAESMAAGIPAIASDWSGLRDLVVDGETGFLTRVRSTESVAEAIGKVCADPRRRHEMGRLARDRFLQKYSRERFRRSFADTIDAIARSAVKP